MKESLAMLMFLAAGGAQAASLVPFYDASAFNAAAGALPVETFDLVASDVDLEDRSVTVGQITLRANFTNGGRIDAETYFQPGKYNLNGTTHVYVNLDSNDDTFTLTWADPITAFAADFRSLNARGLERRDTTVTVLGQLVLLPSVESNGDFSFFGVVSDTPFTQVSFAKSGRDSDFGFDNVQYGTAAPVPVPSAAWLMLGGVAAFGAIRARQNRKSKS